jgi:hypothetical protein
MKCARCNAELPKPPYFRNDTCPKCLADLHSCLQCGFYSPGRHNDCAEPQADRVVDKERANFCDYFRAGEVGCAAAAAQRDATLSALDKLFKK